MSSNFFARNELEHDSDLLIIYLVLVLCIIIYENFGMVVKLRIVH